MGMLLVLFFLLGIWCIVIVIFFLVLVGNRVVVLDNVCWDVFGLWFKKVVF